MVDFIKRDKDDIYSKPIIGFLFKNQKFLMTLKIIVLALFLYAIYYGYTHTGKDNLFTWAVFWGIFWSLFMVITLPTLGRVFCGICPHGFIGKYITKFGLKKTMPKWMQNQYIGLLLLVIGWWGIYYMFPGIYRTAIGTAVMFSVMTLISFVVYFLYKDMSYCKYVCPIGTLTRAYSKLSFTWLGTYKSACNECKTFECATACPYNLKPFTFDKRNSMTECTLCMDCSSACEAVSFKVKKPSFSLFSKFQPLKAEVWAFILILAAIPITMSFHHGIGRSNAAGDMIWSKTAEFFKSFISFGSVDPIGLFAFLYAMLFTIVAALVGMFIASKILQKDFSKILYDLGYSYAPLFILGSIAHSLEAFFIRGYEKIVEGFAQGFGFSVDVSSLANRGDSWLHMFGIFKWIAIAWALIILYKRMKLLDVHKMRKIVAYPFAASLIIFFLSINMYRSHILDTYGRASGGHGNHSTKVFQSTSTPEDFKRRATQSYKKPTAFDTVYFSDTNPAAKKKKYGGGHNHGRDRNKVASKKMWPIFEDNSGKKNCLGNIDADLYVLDANLITTKLTGSKDRGCKSVSFKMPNNGYYNLYYNSRTLQDNTLYIQTAKYEKMRFNHSNDAIYDEEKMSAHTIFEVPFDILRLREDGETFYYRLYSGDKIRLKVMLNSKAIQNASLTLSTKTGWSKTIKTDKDGVAVFTLLKDYFPKWNKFDRRHKNQFLLTANYTENSKGTHNDKEYGSINYESTYTSIYYPAESAYRSYAYGLFAATATAILSGFAIYWFRKRRQKPFKEVRFYEKN
ncbi:4Fe-4S binding protein [Sulfurimonas sp.]|uniref:4Fe-4S binding protein n=1 Tax=Sulfurimonas sp. TaxID=2022749 RepID=UPI002B49E3A8|nr:4Fe-4S binding protein [Sulfurimonas sp.]